MNEGGVIFRGISSYWMDQMLFAYIKAKYRNEF